ncbi:hypothetical protein Gorai_004421 [Gossypium raimondii]|uniref:Transcription and mRNA export factor ENY2 n=1 Tax=Gossypium raimondii TaxID=29730 RepID=A0A7J8QIC2_GOSRA|nr:hypothetical protein [Gossypium raimondii]
MKCREIEKLVLYPRIDLFCLAFKLIATSYVKKKGRNNVTLDDLVHLITPKGRASVPDFVKAELLQRIRSFLMSAAL